MQRVTVTGVDAEKIIVFRDDDIFERAVLHHYREMFDEVIVDGERLAYLIRETELNRHSIGESEFWQALKDPHFAATDLKHRESPRTLNDLGWKDRYYASPS